MTPTAPKLLERVCLPYRGKPEKTPLWSEVRAWPGEAVAGHFWTEDLEEARQTLYGQVYLPRVKRGHKAELRRLTCALSKGESLVLRQKPHACGGLS